MKKGSIVFVGLLILLAFFFVACSPMADGVVSSARGTDVETKALADLRDREEQKRYEDWDAKPVTFTLDLPASITLPAVYYGGSYTPLFKINTTVKAGDLLSNQKEAALYSVSVTGRMIHNDGRSTSTKEDDFSLIISRWAQNVRAYRASVDFGHSPSTYFTTFTADVFGNHDDLAIEALEYTPWEELFHIDPEHAYTNINPGYVSPENSNRQWIHNKVTTATASGAVYGGYPRTYLVRDESGVYTTESQAARARSLRANLQLAVTNTNYLMSRKETAEELSTRTAIRYVDDIYMSRPHVGLGLTSVDDYWHMPNGWRLGGWNYPTSWDVTSSTTTASFVLTLYRRVAHSSVPQDARGGIGGEGHFQNFGYNDTYEYPVFFTDMSDIPETLTPANFRVWDAATGAQLGDVPANGTFRISNVSDSRSIPRDITHPATSGGSGTWTNYYVGRSFIVELDNISRLTYRIGSGVRDYRTTVDVILQIVDPETGDPIPGVSPVPFLVSVPVNVDW